MQHLHLFGSTAREAARADSDVDLFFDHARGKPGLLQLMDMKERAAKILQPQIPSRKVAGIGNVLRHAYERTAPEVLWSVAPDDLLLLDKVCRDELAAAPDGDEV